MFNSDRERHKKTENDKMRYQCQKKVRIFVFRCMVKQPLIEGIIAPVIAIDFSGLVQCIYRIEVN